MKTIIAILIIVAVGFGIYHLLGSPTSTSAPEPVQEEPAAVPTASGINDATDAIKDAVN